MSEDTVTFEQIRAKRVNIIDENGVVRLAIANKDRTANPIIGGKEVVTDRHPSAGMIFFNDDGDECGGLIYGDKWAHMSFDQYGQDQILVLQYNESPEGRKYGLTVGDRPEAPLGPMIDRYQAILAMSDGEEKEKAMAEFQAGFHAPIRLFIGKHLDGSASVVMSDSKGKERIRIVVGSDNAPRIEMLDENGGIVDSLVPDISGKEERHG